MVVFFSHGAHRERGIGDVITCDDARLEKMELRPVLDETRFAFDTLRV